MKDLVQLLKKQQALEARLKRLKKRIRKLWPRAKRGPRPPAVKRKISSGMRQA